MKKIKQYLVILSLALSGFSCTDYLDVRPENQMLLDDFWQKESDAEAVLLTCYRAMQEDAFMDRVMLWGELRSDNAVATSSNNNDIKQINSVNILPTNPYCTWASFYTVINYCNTVLKYAPLVVDRDPNFTEQDLQAKEAEALAIRSLCYFYLVRAFRDVPLSLEATIGDDQTLEIPQSAPEAVLQQITDDLLQAEAGALSIYPTTRETKGRMTKDAIRAILADVYLWKKEYGKCVEYCDKLINATAVSNSFGGMTVELPKYELIEDDMSSYDIFGNGNSSESIFELQFSTEKVNNSVVSLYGSSTATGHLTAAVNCAEVGTIFSEEDERRSDFIVVSSEAPYKIFKYLGSRMGGGGLSGYSYKQTTANWIFYRITDIMLMKAEALVQQQASDDNLKEALRLVNSTYMRANPTLLETDTLSFDNYGNATAMEKLVLLERQRELMFEGKRWFDLVRHSERKASTGDLIDYVIAKYSDNLSTITTKLSVLNAIYLPIPKGEIDVNPLLKQNPYYESSSNIEK